MWERKMPNSGVSTSKLINLVGQHKGNQKVLRRVSLAGVTPVIWEVRCDLCGLRFQKNSQSIREGTGKFHHGCKMSPTAAHPAEYDIWRGMINRCNPASGEINYGKRGISVCKNWKESFWNFYRDMGDRPNGRSIDRINNDGNYEPGNCRWATPKEQMNNTRANLPEFVKTLGRQGITRQRQQQIFHNMKGLCGQCKRPIFRAGKCKRHYLSNYEKVCRTRADRRKLNLCVRCGEPTAITKWGRLGCMCEKHRRLANEWNARYNRERENRPARSWHRIAPHANLRREN